MCWALGMWKPNWDNAWNRFWERLSHNGGRIQHKEAGWLTANNVCTAWRDGQVHLRGGRIPNVRPMDFYDGGGGPKREEMSWLALRSVCIVLCFLTRAFEINCLLILFAKTHRFQQAVTKCFEPGPPPTIISPTLLPTTRLGLDLLRCRVVLHRDG